jgi:hypothetical protein
MCREWQTIERTGGGVEAVLREMKVNRGLFQIAMAQQNLDSPQIGAGFEQVCGETVATMSLKT